jgi:Transport and Golgi organisation 2
MCTVSFLPTAQGFRLAMNRDEKRARMVALPPEVFSCGGRRAIYPRERSGGTWLAANDAGLCLALINWHTIERAPNEKPESRGRIIPALAGAAEMRAAVRRLATIPLLKSRPFRLLVFDSRQKTIVELRWDLERLAARDHPWRMQHWFSSGYDEPRAERVRGQICAAWHASLGGTAALRKLHTSHLPRRGPFSICMHRSDAATVSYSEVNFSSQRVTLRYSSGPPCRGERATVKWLALQPAL